MDPGSQILPLTEQVCPSWLCVREVEPSPASWGAGVSKDQGLGPGSQSRVRALAHKVIKMWLFTRKIKTFWHQRRKPNKRKQRRNHRF